MPPSGAKAKKLLPNRRSLIAGVAALAGIAVIGYGVFMGQKENGPAADPNDMAQVAQGQQVYVRECAGCHGADLQGQPNWRQRRPDGRLPAPPHDESGHTWHHPDELLFALTKQGPMALARQGYQSDMPGYAGKLSDKEIWAVLAYIKSRWPKDIRERQEAISRRANERQDRTR